MKAFEISTWITVVLLVINIVLLSYRLSEFQKEVSDIETGRHLTKRGNRQWRILISCAVSSREIPREYLCKEINTQQNKGTGTKERNK